MASSPVLILGVIFAAYMSGAAAGAVTFSGELYATGDCTGAVQETVKLSSGMCYYLASHKFTSFSCSGTTLTTSVYREAGLCSGVPSATPVMDKYGCFLLGSWRFLTFSVRAQLNPCNRNATIAARPTPTRGPTPTPTPFVALTQTPTRGPTKTQKAFKSLGCGTGTAGLVWLAELPTEDLGAIQQVVAMKSKKFYAIQLIRPDYVVVYGGNKYDPAQLGSTDGKCNTPLWSNPNALVGCKGYDVATCGPKRNQWNANTHKLPLDSFDTYAFFTWA